MVPIVLDWPEFRRGLHMSKRRPEKQTASTAPDKEADRSLSAKSAPAPDLIPHLWRFRTSYRDGRDAEKLLLGAVKLAMDLFRAPEGAVLAAEPGSVLPGCST